MVYDIHNEEDFEREAGKGTVLVDFYADWCRPCRMMAPVLEKTADAMEGSVKFCRLNVEEMEDFVEQFQLIGVPIFILFKDGERVGEIVGYNDTATFRTKLEALLTK